MLLVFAFSACNTTSELYGQGKLSILKFLERFKAAMEEVDVLLREDRIQETIFETGTRIFVMLYGGKDSFIDLKYLKYIKMASSLLYYTI